MTTYLKIFRGVWFLSVLALMANMLYVYASLPLHVLILQKGLDRYEVSREISFYVSLVVVAVINVMVYLSSVAYKNNPPLRVWFIGLIISINAFFVSAFSFIGIYNSGEHYDFSRMGTVVYGTMILVTGWAISWPIILLVRYLTRAPANEGV